MVVVVDAEGGVRAVFAVVPVVSNRFERGTLGGPAAKRFELLLFFVLF